MKVERTKQVATEPKQPQFGDLEGGNAFISERNGKTYIRVRSAMLNALDVEDGSLATFLAYIPVTPLPKAVLHTNE